LIAFNATAGTTYYFIGALKTSPTGEAAQPDDATIYLSFGLRTAPPSPQTVTVNAALQGRGATPNNTWQESLRTIFYPIYTSPAGGTMTLDLTRRADPGVVVARVNDAR